MSRLGRLAKIAHVCCKYRLDTLIDKERLPLKMRMALAPAALYSATNLSRGERIRKALEELGPVFIKFGQLLSTRPDLVPADICGELDNLQDNVPPFDPEQFQQIVEKALNGKVAELFQSFDPEPLASASVAQVHAAVLPDGKQVVVKAIRPGIGKIIRQDIALLFTLARLLARYSSDGRRLRPVEVVADYEKTIYDELDLQHEGANASLLRHNFQNSPLLYVPEVYWPYSNRNVLVVERIYATPVTRVDQLQAAGVDFKVLAERGVEIFFTQVFEHNFFHADMHPGNIFVDTSKPAAPSYIAVDCAIMGSLSHDDQYYLARNLLAIFRRDYSQVAELHIASGWISEKTPRHEFAAAIRTVCEPIFQRPISEISLGHILVNLFRTARRFNMEVQPSLVLLEKTLLNVEGLGRQLYPQLDLWATAHPYLEKWLEQRYAPNNLMGELKRYGPEWLEQFPQIPQLVFQSLEQLQRLDKSLQQPANNTPPPPSRWRPRVAGAAIGCGLALAWGSLSAPLSQWPGSALLLLGSGLIALLLR